MSSDEEKKPNAAFLGDLAARLAAGPPKKPVGLVKKPTVSAESEPDAYVPPATGGIGALAGAVAKKASETDDSSASKK